MKPIPKTMSVWWDSEPQPILDGFPYSGKYPQYFTHALKVRAPKTSRGYMEIPVDLREKEQP